MTGFLFLLRAEFGRAFRRRAVAGIGALAVVLVVGASAANHSLVPSSRDKIEDYTRFARRTGVIPGGGGTITGPGGTKTVRFDARDNERRRIRLLQADLGPGRSHLVLLGLLGSGYGIALAIVLAATLFGAEFRWGYWKMLALHQPSRWKLVLAKFIVLFSLLLLGLVALLLISYPVNLAFAKVFGVDTVGARIPLPDVARELMRSWATTSEYAGLAAAITLVTRSSLVGAAAVGVFIFVDGAFASAPRVPGRPEFFDQVYAISLARRIADLFYSYPHYMGLWSFNWPMRSLSMPIDQALSAPGIPPPSRPPPDQISAVLVLVAVALLAVLAAAMIANRRDVPT